VSEKIATNLSGSQAPTAEAGHGSRPPGQSMLASLGSLIWPIVGGLGLTALFYGALHAGLLNLPGGYGALLERYFAGHIVEYIEATLFFIGVTALLLKLADITTQSSLVHQFSLNDGPHKLEKADDAPAMLAWLESLPTKVRQSYLGKRFIDALTHVDRMRDANRLDEELKYLSDLDAIRQQESYGLVRIRIWATPMLGFLGTVIGITMTLANLSFEALTSDNGINELTGGLGVAFDTTALALGLSITLMFALFLLQQVETQLLTTVDLKANEELIGRFETAGGANDPLSASLRRMSQLIMQSCDDLVQRQAELWQSTVETSNQRWQSLTEEAGSHLQASLSGALETSMTKHAQVLAETELQTAAAWREEAQAWRLALQEQAKLAAEHQREMTRQGETLTRTVQAVGEVTRLETALNRNLESLASASHFEETAMSLAAAVQLLSARMGSGEAAGKVQLQPHKQGERAA
jgi:biopolymer transport protein ExbB/TolQ